MYYNLYDTLGIYGYKIQNLFNCVNEITLMFQVSGKYHTNYIYQLTFVTSRGRSLITGQPYQVLPSISLFVIISYQYKQS